MEITYDKLNLTHDLTNADYQLDAIQQEMLKLYIRNDLKFQRAFMTDFTQYFLQFIKDKIRLKEPITLSTMGVVRGGKSYGMIAVCVIHQALQGRLFTSEYICANEMEFMDKLRDFPQDKLSDRIFLIDEEKKAMYGSGSVAKKMKAEDVSNIIAINNISVIRINPVHFPSSEVAWYGLRAFGRCFKTGTIRFMLYNLQEGEHGSFRPVGMVYLPMFTKLLPKDLADEVEKGYLEKKNAWVMKEQRGEMDVLQEIKKRMAEKFVNDEQFKSITKKNERLVYVQQVLGSEWTTSETKDILTLAQMMLNGVTFGS